jgi:putative ABC transport system permease protein
MVSSFRLTFTGWLDQRLASELYLTLRPEDDPAAVLDWLAPRTDAALPIFSAEARFGGQTLELYGMTDHATYRDHWPLLQAEPDVWEAVAAGAAVLVNEQLFRREGLRLGATLPLEGWAPRIAGVYSDYGNPVGQVILSTDRLLALYPDTPRLRYGLRVPPDRAEALRRDLQAAFGLPAANVVDQASIKAFSLQVFERTFAVTAALNVLTLGVAGVAMFASLMTLARMRLPQLAPVWAMGLTRGRLAGLELLRSGVLALGSDGAGAALGAGAGLGAAGGGERGGLWLAAADACVSGGLAAAGGAGGAGGGSGRRAAGAAPDAAGAGRSVAGVCQ